MAEFTSDIRHMAGKENVVADALSCPAAAVAPVEGVYMDLKSLARAQADCPETAELCGRLEVQELDVGGVLLLCDKSGGNIQPLVPAEWRKKIFSSVHRLAHAGTHATRRMVSSCYVWPGLATDVTRWCRDCQQCA